MADPGRDAYRGFEYQIQVTTWLALLFLGEHNAPSIVIEPLGGEDVEILRSSDLVTDTSDLSVALATPGLSVQVKARGTGHWTCAQMNEILAGPKKESGAASSHGRTWPLTALEADPNKNFLFITDSTVEPALSNLVVASVPFVARTVPKKSLNGTLGTATDAVRARIGIWQKFTLDAAKNAARELLASRFNVPHATRDSCLKSIRERVRAALLDAKLGTLSLEDLETIAHEFGGAPEEVSIVEPEEFDRFRKQLDEQCGLLIVGEPGVGKTTAAERLIFEHRKRQEPFALVRPATPSDLRALRSKKEPTLVFVEDPFGRYDPSPQGHEWAVELAGLCQHINSDLRLLITSRRSFATPHLKEKATRLSHYVMSLKASGYDRKALLVDCLRREAGLDDEALNWVLSHAELILEELSRPLSYDNLAAQLALLPSAQRSSASLHSIVKAASSADLGYELENTFADASEPIRKGMVGVWLALEVWSRSDVLRVQLENVAADLMSVGAEVEHVTEVLEKHRWLRRSKKHIQMHPIYIEACARVALKQRVLASGVVAAFIDGLRQRSDVDALWTAYRVAQRVKLRLTPESELTARAAARESLIRAANEGTRIDFAAAFGLLLTNKTAGDPVTLLARTLRPMRETYGRWVLSLTWSLPNWDVATLKQVQADPDARAIVRAFVRQGFPTFQRRFEGAAAFVDFLYDITDVSAEFDELSTSIDEGEDWTSEFIALGAVRSANANLKDILQRGFGILEQADRWWEGLSDDDVDSEYGDWLAENYQYRITPAEALIDALLLKWVNDGDEEWVSRDVHPFLFQRFVEKIVREGGASDRCIKNVFSRCPTHLRARFVYEVAQNRKRLALALELLADVSPAIRVAIIHELRAQVSRAGLTDDVLATASSAEREALAALAADSSASASVAVLELLEGVVASETSASADALRVLARHGRAQANRVFAWLSPDTELAKANGALAALEFLPAVEAKKFAEQGLKHRRAAVRCEALGV
jgi:hypothetical protein